MTIFEPTLKRKAADSYKMESDLEKWYYTKSGVSYLEKLYVLRRCFWIQLTVIMHFMKLCSLNFQFMFSYSPRLTDKKKKNTCTRNCTIEFWVFQNSQIYDIHLIQKIQKTNKQLSNTTPHLQHPNHSCLFWLISSHF